jgi:hypothetical protein
MKIKVGADEIILWLRKNELAINIPKKDLVAWDGLFLTLLLS